MMQKGSMGGPPSSAEIAKLQQQHSAIVAENKKIIKELKQLEAAVSTDQSGAAIARLDKQLEPCVHQECRQSSLLQLQSHRQAPTARSRPQSMRDRVPYRIPSLFHSDRCEAEAQHATSHRRYLLPQSG